MKIGLRTAAFIAAGAIALHPAAAFAQSLTQAEQTWGNAFSSAFNTLLSTYVASSPPPGIASPSPAPTATPTATPAPGTVCSEYVVTRPTPHLAVATRIFVVYPPGTLPAGISAVFIGRVACPSPLPTFTP